jgi:hypothetical protein
MKDQYEVGNQMGVPDEDYLETIEWLEEELQSECGPDARMPFDKDVLVSAAPLRNPDGEIEQVMEMSAGCRTSSRAWASRWDRSPTTSHVHHGDGPGARAHGTHPQGWETLDIGPRQMALRGRGMCSGPMRVSPDPLDPGSRTVL